MVGKVPDDEPVGHLCDRELTSTRMEAAPRELGRREAPPAPIEALEVSVDPVVKLSRRHGPVAFDQGDAHRVGRDPAERHGVGISGEHPLDLAQPVRNHLREVGEDFARPPAGLIRVIEGLGQWPRRPGFHGGSGGGKAGSRSRQTVEQVIHARQCGTRGVAWMATTTGRPRLPVHRGRPPRRQQGRPSMTQTESRGAANQAGARIDTDAYAKAEDFLPLKGIDHVEFWVGNARQAAAYYRALWGFTPVAFSGLETKVRDRASYVMVQNDIRFVFTAPLTPDGEIAEHVRAHGDGVHDIAFAVDDVESAWRETTTRGAVSALAPTELDGGADGTLRKASIHTYGEVLHSFVDRGDYAGVFAPGFRKVTKPARAAGGLSLLEVDHCVGNVGLGQMDEFVAFYRDVLGFAQLIHYDDKVIHTEYSALMSKVMTNGNGRVKFPINEPAAGKKKSQIQEYLDWYHSPGCQHIALRTDDIVKTVRQLRDNGVEFLGLPHEYYASLADRVGDVGVPIDTLEELGIEADRDEEGYLLQIFTRPVQDRPTFFFEIIERHGSRGFGVGNFKALFEAIEREQEKRGNL